MRKSNLVAFAFVAMLMACCFAGCKVWEEAKETHPVETEQTEQKVKDGADSLIDTTLGVAEDVGSTASEFLPFPFNLIAGTIAGIAATLAAQRSAKTVRRKGEEKEDRIVAKIAASGAGVDVSD